MRTPLGRLVLALLAAAFVSGPLVAADLVVLKDGRTLSLAKPYVVKGSQAILTLANGQLVSVRADEIDVAKTQAALAAPSPAAPAPKPQVTPQPSLVDAAKATPGKKASIILTDADVLPGLGPEGASGEDGEVKIDVVGQTSIRGPEGYTLTAQVVNSGSAEATGLTVSVEAVGDGNTTVATVFGRLAKDSLAPEERTALTASVPTDKVVKTFRFLPKWTVKVGVRPAGEAGAAGGPNPQAGQPDGVPPTPAPKPEAKKAEPPAYVPRPDYAAPAPNVPVGAPAQPGGGYVPANTTTDQPKPPGGS